MPGSSKACLSEGLTPRPGLAEAVRELNRYREQTTPKGPEKKGTPKRASVAKPGAREFAVTVDEVFHGSIQVTPPVPATGKVEAGTVLTVKAEPDSGYAIDSVYYAVVGYQGMDTVFGVHGLAFPGKNRSKQTYRRIIHPEIRIGRFPGRPRRGLYPTGCETAEVRRVLPERSSKIFRVS